MNFKKFFKEKILGIMNCPIPNEYKNNSDEHIFICSGNCTKCYHFQSYQFASYRKEAEEYIQNQAKIIADLNQKLEDSQKLAHPEYVELQELRDFKNDISKILIDFDDWKNHKKYQQILQEIALEKCVTGCRFNDKDCTPENCIIRHYKDLAINALPSFIASKVEAIQECKKQEEENGK